jgi:hypothetical protein
MTVMETIMRDLQGLPLRKLVEVARYVHQVSAAGQEEREKVLRATYGSLSEEDGVSFEEALKGAREVEAHG